MDIQHHRTTIIFAAIALLLQIVLAPNIQLGNALPSFIVTFVIAFVLVNGIEPHYVLAFVMGFLADLLGSTALGLTPLLLLVCAFAVGMVSRTVGNDNMVTCLLVILIALFAVNLIYGIYFIGTGAAGLGDALLYRVLPCTLFDAILGAVWYVVLMRFAAASSTRHVNMGGDGTTNIRF